MLNQLSSFDKVNPQAVNKVIREVNQLGNLKVFPPLEYTNNSGNPQLRLIGTGFMAVITKVTAINISPSSFSSGRAPAPSNSIIYYYDVEELRQTEDGEWEVLENGRILTYETNYGVFEWNGNLVPVGTVVEVQQTTNLYDWTFFAPGGTVCTQAGELWSNAPILTNQLQGYSDLATWYLPSAGTWLVLVSGGIELTVDDTTEGLSLDNGGSTGTAYLQVTSPTFSFGSGFDFAAGVYGSVVTPVTATSYGVPGYAAASLAIKFFFITQIPCYLTLQGYVAMDNPCPTTDPPCATFSCGFGEAGLQIQWAWMGPTCIAPGAGYSPGFLDGCGCFLSPTGYEYDTLAACLNYLEQADTGCGGSGSSSSSPSCTLSSSSQSNSSTGCLCPTTDTVTVNLIDTGWNCNLTGSYVCRLSEFGTWIYSWNSFSFPYIGYITVTCDDDGTATIDMEMVCNPYTSIEIFIDVSGSLCPLDMGGTFTYEPGENGCCWGCFSATLTN